MQTPNNQENTISTTLVELLSYRATQTPDTVAYTFLKDGETQEDVYTYYRLHIRAQAIARHLQELGLAGERILLLYHPGMAFLEGFFGCLYAGAIAVPAYPPRKNRSAERIHAIMDDADAKAILTEETISFYLKKKLENEQADIHWVISSAIPDTKASEWQMPSITSDTIAFLQYTSGSTGTPKGVMVTHTNILDNEALVKASFGHSDQTIFVGWLPLYHDMGLIGNVLQPLYLGIHCILMSPVYFLQKPVRWFKAISRYKGTTGGAPNFAYELCLQKITDEQMDGIDLSSWDLAYNGSEPVRAETLERFAERFAPYGFRKEAFYPCYGMAEVTLFATGHAKSDLPRYAYVDKDALQHHTIVWKEPTDTRATPLVSCGHPWLSMCVQVVNPDTRKRCAEAQIGEIWITGKSVAKGYWNKPDLTKNVFEAYLSDTHEGPFLRTGDLGFIQDGHLFITGRIKELIIIRGRNFYPQDLERTVEQTHIALRPGCGAAFSIETQTGEELVIVHEIDHQYYTHITATALEVSIRSSLVKEYDVNPLAIVLIQHLSLPKTSSGKTQRFLARQYYLQQTLEKIPSTIAESVTI